MLCLFITIRVINVEITMVLLPWVQTKFQYFDVYLIKKTICNECNDKKQSYYHKTNDIPSHFMLCLFITIRVINIEIIMVLYTVRLYLLFSDGYTYFEI